MFKNYKPVAKSCIKFKILDIYGNPIGTIPVESATAHPEIPDKDHLSDNTPDDQKKMMSWGIIKTGQYLDLAQQMPSPNQATTILPPQEASASKSANLTIMTI